MARKQFPRGLRVRVGRSHSGITAVKQELALMRWNIELDTELRAKGQLDRTAGDFAGAIEVFAREYFPKSKLPAKSR